MKQILIKKIQKREVFKIEHIPAVAKIYAWGMQGGRKSKLQSFLFSTLGCLLYLLLQRFYPFEYKGTFILKSSQKKERIRFNAKNAQFDQLYRSCFHNNGFEPEVSALLDTLIQKSDVFYEIGSNWGDSSLFVATKPNFQGHVYAFEPFPTTYKDLMDVVSQTSVRDKITCLPIALSDHNGAANMSFSGILQSGFAYIHEGASGGLSPKATVKVNALDSLDIKPPSIIKIDAQFHEGPILKGAKKILAQYKPLIIMENCLNFNNTSETMEPLRILEEMGYIFYFPSFINKKEHDILIPSEADRDNFASDMLALVPFQLNERFLYRDTINVLACHKDKLKLLNSLFHPLG